MIISLNWLNTYLDRHIDAGEADRVLTDVGFPLDGLEQLGTGDVALDVEVTSNRPDCLSHVGVAREIAAATGRSLHEPTIALPDAGESVERVAGLTNEASDLCPQYTARVIRGVKVGRSPDWLVERLEAIGLRPVNNVVDVTNFVLHELGQPLHAFDLNKLNDQRIVVRRAEEGEAFTAIDSTRHKLRSDMLVIADGRVPVAVAGVMGGLDSEVGEATTDVLLEAARFEPLSVRTTSRALKLSSDSSYRFERGVDPRGVDRAAERAAQLILDLAGGKRCAGVLSEGQPMSTGEPMRVSMRPERCRMLLGIDLDTKRMAELLAALGLSPVEDGDAIACTIPSHRLDLEREADLIEEVARMHGLDNVPLSDRMTIAARPPQRIVQARQLAGRVLVAHGYHETITFSTVAPQATALFAETGGSYKPIMLEDERAASPMLRPTLLPSLLEVRKTNQDAGNKNVKLFEVARTFGIRDDRYREMTELGLLADAADAASVRALRGTLEELGQSLGWRNLEFVDAGKLTPRWAGAAGMIVDPYDKPGRILGIFGRASDDVLKQFDLTAPVDLAWLDYDKLIEAYPPQPEVAQLPRFPAIERDLSVIVDETTRWREIASGIDKTEPELLESVEFVTTYRGKQVGKGRKSVTFRMSFRDPERTLRHDEVDPQVDKVVATLKADVNAELRA